MVALPGLSPAKEKGCRTVAKAEGKGGGEQTAGGTGVRGAGSDTGTRVVAGLAAEGSAGETVRRVRKLLAPQSPIQPRQQQAPFLIT